MIVLATRKPRLVKRAAVPPLEPRKAERRVLDSLSLDHLIGAQQERLGNRDPERLRSSNVYNKIEFDWLFNWNFFGLRPAQNLVNKAGSTSEQMLPSRADMRIGE
jgi:hypothetical protein